ncbi:hypothetical protein L596_023267 [Steinernema carpocapsae]|uniref:Uncharacterized protein n=1 Tax=Steinernema carpocapsae TaxID=34508 RepID=A0A4U5MD41_STECR|nr:hypothetical protein L596_023267 [Steinernema carpocapsae]
MQIPKTLLQRAKGDSLSFDILLVAQDACVSLQCDKRIDLGEETGLFELICAKPLSGSKININATKACALWKICISTTAKTPNNANPQDWLHSSVLRDAAGHGFRNPRRRPNAPRGLLRGLRHRSDPGPSDLDRIDAQRPAPSGDDARVAPRQEGADQNSRFQGGFG